MRFANERQKKIMSELDIIFDDDTTFKEAAEQIKAEKEETKRNDNVRTNKSINEASLVIGCNES